MNLSKKIKEVCCDCYEEAFAMLNMLEQVSIQKIEDIRFRDMNEEDFEQITNQLLNFKIQILNYEFSWESIYQTLENISKINPQKLYQLILNIWKLC